MRFSSFLFSLTMMGLVSASAAAQDEPDEDGSDETILPTPKARRPIVMPATTIRGDLSLSVTRVSLGGFGAQTAVGFPMIGAGVSLTDWFQLDVAFLPLIISPDVDYFSPEVAATFEFTDNDADFEAGFRVGALIPPGNNEIWGVSFGFPLRVHAGDVFRLDTGVQAMVFGSTGGGDPLFGLLRQSVVPNRLRPGVPLDVTVNPIDYVYIGAGTGFGMLDVTSNSGIDPGDAIFVPLGFSAGGNIPIAREMVLDVGLDFDFPYFILPAADPVVNADFWQLSFTTSFHYSIE